MSAPDSPPTQDVPPRQDAPPPAHAGFIDRDHAAYLAPMAAFLLLIWVGTLSDALYPIAYVARTAIAAGLLVYFWKHYTKIRWDYWWLGILVGVIGIFQWVPMQLWLQHHFSIFVAKPESVYQPASHFSNPIMLWSFIGVRIVGAVLVVPVMEELFWRDFLWREIIAPNDFKLAHVGEWDPAAFFIVAGAFSTVHANWWLTAVVWGLLIGALLVYTKSLGACIIAHATTNLLLAGYVLWTQDWSFW
jgi:CAAX prenyl protease-like protein